MLYLVRHITLRNALIRNRCPFADVCFSPLGPVPAGHGLCRLQSRGRRAADYRGRNGAILIPCDSSADASGGACTMFLVRLRAIVIWCIQHARTMGMTGTFGIPRHDRVEFFWVQHSSHS